MAIVKRKQKPAAKVNDEPKAYETIFRELKAGVPARNALPPRAPGCTSHLQSYATQVKAVSSIHNYKGCSSACQGKPHPAGWFCEFCIKQPIQGDSYSPESHWKHLQECSMMCLGNAARTREERAAARQLFVCAISYLDGYNLTPSRKAAKAKKAVKVVKKPKLIAVAAKGKASKKVQQPTLVRYPVNNQSRSQQSSSVSLQSHASTSGASQIFSRTSENGQSHFAPTPFPPINAETYAAGATSSADITVPASAAMDYTAGFPSPSQSALLGRPPLQPPGPPTPNPSPSPSLSSLIRQPTVLSAAQGEGVSAIYSASQARHPTRSAYMDLTGDGVVDIKPDLSSTIPAQQGTPSDDQLHIPGLPPYLRPHARYFRLGGLTNGRLLLNLKATQIVKYVERLHSRSAGTEQEMDALTQLDIETGLERFISGSE